MGELITGKDLFECPRCGRCRTRDEIINSFNEGNSIIVTEEDIGGGNVKRHEIINDKASNHFFNRLIEGVVCAGCGNTVTLRYTTNPYDGGNKMNDEQQRDESVEMTGDTMNREATSGGSKPQFDKITKVHLINAVFKQNTEKKTQADGKEYTPFFLSVTFEKEDRTQFFETYGGGRIYDSDNLYIGGKSGLGKLRTKVREYSDVNDKLSSLQEYLIGKFVGVKTEEINVAGERYFKNEIKQIYTEG